MSPIEPSAVMRTFAHMMREMFIALLAEDFTEPQALTIIGQTIAASFIANKENEGE